MRVCGVTQLVPTEIESIASAMKIVHNPSVMNERLHQNISVLLDEIKGLLDSDQDIGETDSLVGVAASPPPHTHRSTVL